MALVLALSGCSSQGQPSSASPESSSSAAPSATATAAASAAAPAVMTDADYPGLIEGSLTREEMTNVAQVLIQNGIIADGKAADYLLYFCNVFETIQIDIVQESIPDSQFTLDHMSAEEANRCLSSFTDFRFTAETTPAEEEGSTAGIYLKDGCVYWKEGGIGGARDYEETAEIIKEATMIPG